MPRATSLAFPSFAMHCRASRARWWAARTEQIAGYFYRLLPLFLNPCCALYTVSWAAARLLFYAFWIPRHGRHGAKLLPLQCGPSHSRANQHQRPGLAAETKSRPCLADALPEETRGALYHQPAPRQTDYSRRGSIAESLLTVVPQFWGRACQVSCGGSLVR